MSEIRTSKGVMVTPLTNQEAVDIVRKIDDDFAQKLVADLDRIGSLSMDQWAWMHRLAIHGPSEHRKYERIHKFMKDASPDLHLGPRIKLELLAGTLVLQMQVGGRYPGTIWVSNGVSIHQGGVQYGWINPEAVWTNGRGFEEWILEPLDRFDQDPIDFVTRYGLKTCRCCLCGGPLRDAVSQALGYGKTCAKHWRLPHGKEFVEASGG